MSDFEAQACIDAIFETLGIDAILDPDGTAIPVLVLPFQDDDVGRFGTIEILDESGIFEIRKADFAGFSDNAVLTVDGVRRSVQSHRVRDSRRLKVVLNTVAVP